MQIANNNNNNNNAVTKQNNSSTRVQDSLNSSGVFLARTIMIHEQHALGCFTKISTCCSIQTNSFPVENFHPGNKKFSTSRDDHHECASVDPLTSMVVPTPDAWHANL